MIGQVLYTAASSRLKCLWGLESRSKKQIENKTGTNLKSPRGKTGGNFNDDELFRNAKHTSRKEKMVGDEMKNMEGGMKWNKNNVSDNCVVFYGCWPLRGQNPGLGCVSLGSFERPLRGLSGIMRDRGQMK